MRFLKRLWAWFDDITGTSQALGTLLMHPVPNARKSRWFYVLGSATLAAFLVQVVTGIALSSSYVTGSGQAYDSLRFITDAPLGSILRGMHYYGSTAMIILIGLHVIRVYPMAAYMYPMTGQLALRRCAVTWNFAHGVYGPDPALGSRRFLDGRRWRGTSRPHATDR